MRRLLCTTIVSCIVLLSVAYSQPVSAEDSAYINNFSLTVAGSKILLSWQTANFGNNQFITIERSRNGQQYETLGIVRSSTDAELMRWTDEAPAGGRNIYRIKFEDKSGEQFYTNPLETIFKNHQSYKFYPNPVDRVLIIQSEQPLEVQVIDQSGKSRSQMVKVKGIQTIDLSSLEKGVYFLRCNNLETNMVTLDRLIKN